MLDSSNSIRQKITLQTHYFQVRPKTKSDFSLFGPFTRGYLHTQFVVLIKKSRSVRWTGKGLWDELLGVGQFYNDLSVQVLRDESEGWFEMMKFTEHLPAFAYGS